MAGLVAGRDTRRGAVGVLFGAVEDGVCADAANVKTHGKRVPP
jgi:hypothetical protein